MGPGWEALQRRERESGQEQRETRDEREGGISCREVVITTEVAPHGIASTHGTVPFWNHVPTTMFTRVWR